MKRNHNSITRLLTAVLTLFMVPALLIAQTPTTFNYQAVLRNTDGTVKKSVNVNIGLEIHQATETGTVVYSETHSATTSDFGMVNLEIGSVTPATFATIDWAAGPYFVEVSVDGLAMGTSELLTVPYALYAVNGVPGAQGDPGPQGVPGPEGPPGVVGPNTVGSAEVIDNSLTADDLAPNSVGSSELADGSGSGIDADLLDGQDGSYYFTPRVAFSAYNSGSDLYTTLGWRDVEFNTEVFDDGNNYDNVNDRFVAPVTGVYHFTAKVGTNATINTVGYVIMGYTINGGSNVKLQLHYSSTTVTHEVTHNGSFTVRLNAGDYVTIRFYTGVDTSYSILGSEYSTVFCGHIVYAD